MKQPEFLPADTAVEIHERQLEAYRRMGGPARSAIAFRLNETARLITEAGIRARHPDYDDARVRRAYVRLRLGDDWMRKIWPDDPLVDP